MPGARSSSTERTLKSSWLFRRPSSSASHHLTDSYCESEREAGAARDQPNNKMHASVYSQAAVATRPMDVCV